MKGFTYRHDYAYIYFTHANIYLSKKSQKSGITETVISEWWIVYISYHIVAINKPFSASLIFQMDSDPKTTNSSSLGHKC